MASPENIVPIVAVNSVTHDVKSFRVNKPAGYSFQPGQATEVSINTPELKDEKRPFTFTSLQNDPYLEFTIKAYKDHNGVTRALHDLKAGDELIIRDVWGAIEYKGPGYFIAGGAGITPFLAILRKLHQDNAMADNVLFFSNKTQKDIIHEEELKSILGPQAHFLLSREAYAGYYKGRIDAAYIKQHVTDFSKHFYICGPDAMVSEITGLLQEAGASADSVIFEK